jgi:hypothetical protein
MIPAEENFVETQVDGGDGDVHIVKQTGEIDDVPLMIHVLTENETRDAEGSIAAVEDSVAEEREHSNATAGKKNKHKTRKSSKARRQHRKDQTGFDNVISALDKNITTARKHKHQLAASNVLITPVIDDVIDKLIYRCDPLFEANYEDSCAKLLHLEDTNEEPLNMNYGTNVGDQLESKIDRILALTELHGVLNAQDDVHSNKLDHNRISTFVHQKREMDDLMVSKGLVDAELQETKEELRNAMDAMKLLKEEHEELKAKMKENEEYAAQREKEMSENYMKDLGDAQSTIEQMKKEREIEETLDQKHVADIKLTLEKETEHNKQLSEECLMLKQQLVAERKKRMSLDDYIHDIGNQNEELLSKLDQRELYCIELEQRIKEACSSIRKAKGIKKEHKQLHKINDTLNSKLLSSKEKLKHSRRERNELLFRLERLCNSLIAETQTQIMKSADEGESCMDLEDDVDNELFLDRQNRRLERMHNIMSLHG